MNSTEKINNFIEGLLTESQISYICLENGGYRDDDLICTFYSFLIVRTIIRIAPGYAGSDVYYFSKPGRSIMENKIIRNEFIVGFLQFYDQTKINFQV